MLRGKRQQNGECEMSPQATLPSTWLSLPENTADVQPQSQRDKYRRARGGLGCSFLSLTASSSPPRPASVRGGGPGSRHAMELLQQEGWRPEDVSFPRTACPPHRVSLGFLLV